MKKYFSVTLFVFSTALLYLYSCASLSQPQPTKEMLMDVATNLVTQKFVNSSCEQLVQMQKTKPGEGTGPGAALEKKALEMLRNDPQMREEFINRVAGPMANRMFECGLIP